jgi:hypothetical protein
MDPAASRFSWWTLFIVAAIAAGTTTAVLVVVPAAAGPPPPCDGPICFLALRYMFVSAIGGAIAATAVSAYAGRGGRGYAVALLGGAAGYVAFWSWLLNNRGLADPWFD